MFVGDVRSAKPVTLTTDGAELRLSGRTEQRHLHRDAHRRATRAARNWARWRKQKRSLRTTRSETSRSSAISGARRQALPRRKSRRRDRRDSGSPIGGFPAARWTHNADRAFGPILFSQYTLSGGVMKLTAQMPPVGAQDSQAVRLQIKRGTNWSTVGESQIHPDAQTAAPA